jgi:hypothetical protein
MICDVRFVVFGGDEHIERPAGHVEDQREQLPACRQLSRGRLGSVGEDEVLSAAVGDVDLRARQLEHAVHQGLGQREARPHGLAGDGDSERGEGAEERVHGVGVGGVQLGCEREGRVEGQLREGRGGRRGGTQSKLAGVEVHARAAEGLQHAGARVGRGGDQRAGHDERGGVRGVLCVPPAREAVLQRGERGCALVAGQGEHVGDEGGRHGGGQARGDDEGGGDDGLRVRVGARKHV